MQNDWIYDRDKLIVNKFNKKFNMYKMINESDLIYGQSTVLPIKITFKLHDVIEL